MRSGGREGAGAALLPPLPPLLLLFRRVLRPEPAPVPHWAKSW